MLSLQLLSLLNPRADKEIGAAPQKNPKYPP